MADRSKVRQQPRAAVVRRHPQVVKRLRHLGGNGLEADSEPGAKRGRLRRACPKKPRRFSACGVSRCGGGVLQ